MYRSLNGEPSNSPPAPKQPWESDREFLARCDENRYMLGNLRRRRMTQYRERGFSYAQIGERFGVTRMRVWQIVNQCNRRYGQHNGFRLYQGELDE